LLNKLKISNKMEDNKNNNSGFLIDFNEPNESSARKGGELFPGEIDNLLSLVDTWTKYQPQSRGNSVKFEKKDK
jgi:hypothetical protein